MPKKALHDAPNAPRPVAYPALLIRQNSHRFYFTTIPIDDLFPWCFVRRRHEDPEIGFQRALNEARAEDIAKYLANGNGSIPSNIVVSAQDIADVRYNRSIKSLSFARVTSAFMVLDGQHRLWGYQKCGVRHRVPVAIYNGLTLEDETKIFIDINTTQRGVPAALLLDIKHLAALESSKESVLRNLFDRLRTQADSPLAGKLSPHQSVAGKISRVTFNKAMAPVLESATMVSASSEETRYRVLVNFLKAVELEFDRKVLVRASFFEAIMGLFDEIVRASITLYKGAKTPDLQQVLEPLAKVNIAGNAGRELLNKTEIQNALRIALRQAVPISDDML